MAKKAKKVVTRVVRASRYLYVEARAWFSEDSKTGNGAEGTLDGPISFDSIQVKAKNDESAYTLGAAALQDQQLNDTGMFTEDGVEIEGSHVTGKFLNDYVVKL